MDFYGVTFATIVLGVLFTGTGSTKHDTPFGLSLMWVGVIYMLAVVGYRIYIAAHYWNATRARNGGRGGPPLSHASHPWPGHSRTG